MYQLFLRPFTPEGTLKAAEARLPFVKSLGTDILYLCPVATADRGTDPTYWSSRQKQSRLGNPCNPYRIADYFGIDPEYGTEQDLKDFVAAAHGLGMKVLFDVVYYHCGPNAVFLKDQPEWALRNADGSFQLGEWAFPRLDVKNPAVREYFFENMAWYLREFQCDGFRCDVGGMLPLWYREEAYRRNKAVKDDVVMLCEGADPREQQVAFDLCYAFPMQVAIRDFLAGKGSATNLSVNCVQRESRFPKGYHWMRCFQNHDYANCAPGQKRWEEKYGLALNDALLVTLFTLDGVPMVYNGQEIADTAPHSIWSNRFHGKWGIDWSRAFTPEGGHRLALVRARSAPPRPPVLLRRSDGVSQDAVPARAVRLPPSARGRDGVAHRGEYFREGPDRHGSRRLPRHSRRARRDARRCHRPPAPAAAELAAGGEGRAGTRPPAARVTAPGGAFQ